MLKGLILGLALSIGFSSVASAQASDPPRRTVENVTDQNAYTKVDWREGKKAREDNVLFRNYDLKCGHYCIYIGNGASNLTFDGVKLRQKAPSNDITAGMALMKGDNILLKNLDVQGFVSTDPKYPNADGVVMDRLPSNVTIEDSYFAFNSNGGIDSKATNLVLKNVVSEENGYNYRCWSTWFAGTITSKNPRGGGHIQTNTSLFNGKAAPCILYIDKFIAFSDDANQVLFGITKGAQVYVKECEFHVPANQRVLWYNTGAGATKTNSTVSLGKNCVNEDGTAHVYVAPPVRPEGFDVGERLYDSNNDGIVQLTTAATIQRLNDYIAAHGGDVVLKYRDSICPTDPVLFYYKLCADPVPVPK